MIALKCCPFCGGDAQIYSDNANGLHVEYIIRCNHCFCAPFAGSQEPDVLAAKWNNRTYLKELEACSDEYEALEIEVQAYEECMEDHRRLVREIDIMINGTEGAARQASLCDLLETIRRLVEKRAL